MTYRISSALHPKFLVPVAGIVAAGALLATAFSASAAQPPVDLGSATSFAGLAGSTVTNTGPSVVSGDLGVSPGSAVTGFRPPSNQPGLVIHGSIHKADSVADLAQSDETTAYGVAAGRSPVTNVPVELGGTSLVGGVYASNTLGLTGTLTLTGDASSVWVFKASSTLITSTASQIVLTGGATACNVFWQIGSSATLGAGSNFVGTILAHTAITAETGATVQGRLFAQTAAVTLDSNTITRPSCTTPVSTSSHPAPSSSTGTRKPGGTKGSSSGGSGGSGGSGSGSSGHHHHGTTSPAASVVASRTSTTGTGLGTTKLADTGSNLETPLVVGLLSIAGGTAILLGSRRRAGARHRR